MIAVTSVVAVKIFESCISANSLSHNRYIYDLQLRVWEALRRRFVKVVLMLKVV